MSIGLLGREVATVTTTDATVTTLWSLASATGKTYQITVYLLAKRTDVSPSTWGTWLIVGSFDNDGGTLSQHATSPSLLVADLPTAAVATMDTTGTTIRLRVTGVIAQTFRWDAEVQVRRN